MARLYRSIWYALHGIKQCFTRERHFKIHTASGIVVITAGLFFKVSSMEWLVILVCIASVFTAELINTSIEELCNIVHKENHPGIKLVKDIAAGAVLIMAIAAAISGAVIFIPKIILFINQ